MNQKRFFFFLLFEKIMSVGRNKAFFIYKKSFGSFPLVSSCFNTEPTENVQLNLRTYNSIILQQKNTLTINGERREKQKEKNDTDSVQQLSVSHIQVLSDFIHLP